MLLLLCVRGYRAVRRQVLDRGAAARTTAETLENERSSRSHSILRVEVALRRNVTAMEAALRSKVMSVPAATASESSDGFDADIGSAPLSVATPTASRYP